MLKAISMSETKLRICKWEAKGLRSPDYKIDLETDGKSGELPKASLIMMANGTGKTTTLKCIRAAFSGEADDWGHEEIKELKKPHCGEGFFMLEIEFNNQRISIKMSFDFTEPSVTYFTNKGKGFVNGHNLPGELRLLYTKEFSRLNIFDGEEAVKLTDEDETKADQAVNTLFKLNYLTDIEQVSTQFFQEQTKDTKAKQTAGLQSRIKKLNEFENVLRRLQTESENLEKQESILKEEIIRHEQEYGDQLNENKKIADTIEEYEMDLKRTRGLVNRDKNEALELIHNPIAVLPGLGDKLFSLRKCLDRAKLPENTSKEFFEDLACDDRCVCGEPITAERKKTILDRAQRYLGSDEVSVLNTIKSEISNALSEGNNHLTESLNTRLSSLKEAVNAEANTAGIILRFRKKIEGEHPGLKEAVEKKTRAEEKLKRITERLKVINDPKPLDKSTTAQAVTSQFEAERLVEHHQEIVNKQRNTHDLYKKSRVIEKVLRRAHTLARQKVSVGLANASNKAISNLMPENHLVVTEIDRCIRLQGKKQGSVGETLCIGYSFLYSLFEQAASFSLPLVVDSPAGALDNSSRRQLGRLIPKVSQQFIAFVISSEREAFLPSLKEEIGENISYFTVYRTTDMRDTPPPPVRTISSDGVVVPGKEFFTEFQTKDSED